MRLNEEIVGYDVREKPIHSAARWDARRKLDYLYRLDVESPLSTDTTVWPSVLAKVSEPAAIGHQGLWIDLKPVLSHTNSKLSSSEPGWVIAISIVPESLDQYQLVRLRSLDSTATPSVPDELWSLLGYDVSDIWLLSALTNCGFSPSDEDVESLRAAWGPRLNRFHLFDDVQAAVRFRDISNERIPEHSPFYVLGLWLIQPEATLLEPNSRPNSEAGADA